MEKHERMVPERALGTISIRNPKGEAIAIHSGEIMADTLGSWILELVSNASNFWHGKCQEPGFLDKIEIKTWEETEHKLRIVVQLKI